MISSLKSFSSRLDAGHLILFILFTVPAVTSISQSSPVFPLRISQNGHYLVDQNKHPFLINGDTPWEMLWQLRDEEVDQYFQNRVDKKFNTILVNVLADNIHGDNPYTPNKYGERPFTDGYDYSKPNDRYFQQLDKLVQKALNRNIFVMLCPTYLGWEHEAWFDEVLTNGPEKCYQYGKFLGMRYKQYGNVMWVMGGDNAPDGTEPEFTALVKGLKEANPDYLVTFHGRNDASSSILSFWKWDINMVYTYFPPALYDLVYHDYLQVPAKPVFLGESGYELESNDGNGGSALRVRRQAYWAILSGGMGHLYGAFLAWSFEPGWQKNLDLPGAGHMKYLADLFKAYNWWELVPDRDHRWVTSGYGIEGSLADYVSTAYHPSGKLMITYVSISHRLGIDLSQFSGPVKAYWYDPTSGLYSDIHDSSFANTGRKEFTPPPVNAAGDTDWILVLQVK